VVLCDIMIEHHWLQVALVLPLKWIYVARATAQAVCCRLPTAAARVRAQSCHVGLVVGKVTLGQVFFIWFVRLLALRPLLAYYASLG
jgi:hypothetical protein